MPLESRAGFVGAAITWMPVLHFFTESLILAQDERWRRA
jgi:hypothetical protein